MKLLIILTMSLILLTACAPPKWQVEKEWCNGIYAKGKGTISYCDGKPFVCGTAYFERGQEYYSCNWVEKPVIGEDCSTRLAGKVTITECEEILE